MRRVRTLEGSRYYDLPVGAPITKDAIEKARQRNGGKPAPRGSTTQSSAVRRAPAQRVSIENKNRESALASRKVSPQVPLSPPPRRAPKSGSVVKVGSASYKVDSDSRTFTRDGGKAQYNVDADGNLRVLTSKGEARLTPDQESRVKSLMVDEQETLEEADPPSRPQSRFDRTPEKETQIEQDRARREEGQAQQDQDREARRSQQGSGGTGLFNEYDPDSRDPAETTPLTDMGFDPEEEITVYRGVPEGVDSINEGDWVTADERLAKDYAGTGKVVSMKVKAKDLLTEPSQGSEREDLLNEMVYRPEAPKGPSTDSEVSVAEAMAMRPSPSGVNQEHVDRLAEQMRREGRFVGEPIQVEETRTRPIVTDGNHRLLAAEKAGLSTVPIRTYANTPEGNLAALKAINAAERRKEENPDGPTYGDTPSAPASPPERNPNSTGESVTPAPKDFMAMAGSPLTGRHITADGDFTPERKAVHEKIISDFLEGVDPAANPVQYMNGGGPASGKGTMTRGDNARITGYPPTHIVDDDGNFVRAENPGGVIIDPDQLKLSLPEGREAVQRRAAGEELDTAHQEWAANLHEESSYLGKRLHQAALDRGVHLVLDGVNDTSVAKVRDKVDQARAAGYSVEANYIYLDPEEGLRRAQTRAARSGRNVPPQVVLDAYENIPIVFDGIKTGVFDKVRLFDNNLDGQPGRLVAEGSGDNFEFLNPEYEDVYERFLESREIASALLAAGPESGAEAAMRENLRDLAGG